MTRTSPDATAHRHRIESIEALEALYGAPKAVSIAKEIGHISEHYRAFIEKSPFAIIATVGPEGLDCSPRGDPPGFVRVQDENTVLLPDRRGNNRLDTLRNIVRDPRVSLLFLIPGVGESLRINGRAQILAEPALCASFRINGATPASVLSVTVERVYFQCQKALVRSRLWAADSRIDRCELPSTGQMLQALTSGEIDGASYDSEYPARMKETIY